MKSWQRPPVLLLVLMFNAMQPRETRIGLAALKIAALLQKPSFPAASRILFPVMACIFPAISKENLKFLFFCYSRALLDLSEGFDYDVYVEKQKQ